MVLSHDDRDPFMERPDVLSYLEVCSNVYALGRNQHSCATSTHSLSKDRALRRVQPPRSSSSARVRADASGTLRHTSCSTYGSMFERAAERGADQIESNVHSLEGSGFVRDDAVASFIGASSPSSFSRMEAWSEKSDYDCVERIVRQPSRRDSQCVPT